MALDCESKGNWWAMVTPDWTFHIGELLMLAESLTVVPDRPPYGAPTPGVSLLAVTSLSVKRLCKNPRRVTSPG